MTRALRVLSLLGPGFLLAELTGCFTEVGNPEEIRQMTAVFRVDYTLDTLPLGGSADSVTISAFNLTLNDAQYTNVDSTRGHLWQDSPGHLVDFLGTSGRDTLPKQPLGNKNLSELRMNFSLPGSNSLRADTVDFTTFQNNAYIKGTYRFNGSLKHFLYALSDSARALNLAYSKETLDKWYQSGAYHCMITFHALKWFSGVNLQRVTVENDKSGNTITLFDPEHNSDAYVILMDQFHQNFNSQQIYADSLPSQ